ncbi:FG-GAP repeat domain protein [Synechococcus sp. PCC 7335]|uniref:FG-GAP-like repeat-containing protein n=1 Tax=Synechococcus sp. (strain ATCC 29403 / PCC 7335) TaxID=91464 RepID=UPI00017EB408|nr:FG-GAP-like repeat-containing protein [Synechococcus sp. PCC 7335]EDX84980.1 FG-GAP repeat domain protein [Synechococcus sp. PCC 7335]
MCNYCDAYSALVSADPSQTSLQTEAAQLLQPALEMMLGADSQAIAPAAETAQANEAALTQTLSLVVEELQTRLTSFANSEVETLENMRLAFGDSFSAEAATTLLEAWQAGDFEVLPTIEFLSAAELGSANGAYAAQTETIYLSAEAFELYQNDIARLSAIVAEELGHHIDTVLNGAVDSQGDEGAIFSALVQGEALSAEQLQSLQQEDDQVTIVISDGGSDESSDAQGTRTIEVEQNQTSQISFEDVTESAGDFISGRSYGAGAWGDFNGDGLPDLWVNNHFGSGRNLFVNNGDGTFTDIVNQVEAGNSDVFLESEIRGDFHGVAWADFDNDGDQDLLQLVGGEGNTSTLGQENTGDRSEPNRLYVNENGVLRDRAPELGLSYNSAKAQTPTWLDYDNDGRLDLFHGSTQRADGLNPTTVFRQNANGRFDDVGDTVLPTELVNKTVRFGGLGYLSDQDLYDLVLPGAIADLFDVTTTPFTNIVDETIGGSKRLKGARDFAFADFNNDGLIDAYLARAQADRLFYNTADGGLVGVSDSAGIDAVDTSKAAGVVAADFDNDMDVDIYVVRESANGSNLPNILFDNQGDGTFVAVANQGGAVSATTGVGDNATVADYDGDGFMDLFVTNGAKTALRGPQQLFRNRGNENNWLQIDLAGAVSLTDSEGNVRVGTNRDGIGAQVYVTAGGVTQRRDQNGGVHKHSQDFQRLHFGLAQNEQVERIEVRWPSGVVQVLENVNVNQVITITEQITGGGGGSTPVAADDTVTTVEDTAVIFGETTLLSNDNLGDIPTTITAVDTVSAKGGAITGNSDSTYTYTPATDFVGTDSFSYTITDDDGETSSATVTVTVTPQPSSDGLLTDGLVLNLNADAGVSVDTNGVVSGWADQSEFGNDLISAGDPSLLVDALNGRNVIEFDGVGDKLSRTLELNGLPGGNAERTVFLVAKYDGTGYGGAAYGDSSKNQTFGAVVDPNGNLMAQGWGGRNDFSSGELGTGTGWLLQGIVHDGTTVSQYRDGNLIDSRNHTYNTDVVNGEGLVIGAEIDSTPNVNMDVATLLIYDRSLSTNERQQVETYLQEKYFSNDQNDQGGGGSDGNTGNPTDDADLLFSLRNGIYLDGIATRSEDIVRYDGTSFSLFFDGSDVGLGGKGMNVDAFTVISDSELLISFDKAMTLEGAGEIDDSDVVKFTATSLGEVTAGTFELYLDGSDVGLTKGEEDIDGLTGLSDGSLLISTQGPSNVPGASANNEDLLLFRPTSLGENTSGSWSVYFDGSDVGLGDDSQEFIDGIATDAADKLLFSAAGNFDVPGLSGADDDVFGFTASSVGSTTTGSFDTGLLFDGSSFGLDKVNIDAISLTAPAS